MPDIIRRTFTQAVETLRHGATADELDKALRELVRECQDTGRSGTLKLELKIRPNKNGSFDVYDDLKVKLPTAEKTSTILYPTVDGALQRSDPRQGELDGIRSIDTDTREVRKVG